MKARYAEAALFVNWETKMLHLQTVAHEKVSKDNYYWSCLNKMPTASVVLIVVYYVPYILFRVHVQSNDFIFCETIIDLIVDIFFKLMNGLENHIKDVAHFISIISLQCHMINKLKYAAQIVILPQMPRNVSFVSC